MVTDQVNDECEQYLEKLMKQKKEQWKKYTPFQRRYYLLYREFSRASMEEMPIQWKTSIYHAMAIRELRFYVFWNHVDQFWGPRFQGEHGWEYYLPVK